MPPQQHGDPGGGGDQPPCPVPGRAGVLPGGSLHTSGDSEDGVGQERGGYREVLGYNRQGEELVIYDKLQGKV